MSKHLTGLYDVSSSLMASLDTRQKKELAEILDILWKDINEIDTRITSFRGMLMDVIYPLK